MRPSLTVSAGRLAIATAVVAVPVCIGTLAFASPYSSPSVSASTTTPAPGGSVSVTGTGFRPDSAVSVAIHSKVIVLAEVTADANGDASTSVTVPSSFTRGSSHTISLTGVDSSGATHVDSLAIVLTGANAAAPASSSQSDLPFTGLDVVAESATGAALVGFGAFLVFAARRKKAAQGDAAA